MKIVVTGAGGMLGSDVVAVGSRMGHEMVAMTHDDLDVTDPARVERLIVRERPGAVLNCAAWSNVDSAESMEHDAELVNGEGAGFVAAAAEKARAKVLYVSSVDVFDGSKDGPYTEIDDPNPINAYGRSKLAGERATALVSGRSFIVRTSWLFGVEGPNFVEEMLRLGRQGGPVVVVHDQVGSPTFTGHLAAGLLRLLDSSSYGIHHMSGGGSCSWYEFANEIFRQSEVVTRVMAATTEMMSTPAKRPPNSVLGSGRAAPITLPDWQRGLADYLARKEQLAALSEQEEQPPPETGEVELQDLPRAEPPVEAPRRGSSIRRQPVLPLRREPPEDETPEPPPEPEETLNEEEPP
jgi:dTDP-4-dehydrorhamnose reductase